MGSERLIISQCLVATERGYVIVTVVWASTALLISLFLLLLMLLLRPVQLRLFHHELVNMAGHLNCLLLQSSQLIIIFTLSCVREGIAKDKLMFL